MASISCFLLENTALIQRSLRRYGRNAHACPNGYHDASVALDVVAHAIDANCTVTINDDWPHDDPRWPTQCAHCNYVFSIEDAYQLNQERLLRRPDTRELLTIRAARQLPGAMYRASWYAPFSTSQDDGAPLIVVTPGGEWNIDSQATNCTMKDDWHQDRHHCWVREGIPPCITVGKNGVTCAAGAGSIQAGSYHGFLRNGYLEE